VAHVCVVKRNLEERNLLELLFLDHMNMVQVSECVETL